MGKFRYSWAWPAMAQHLEAIAGLNALGGMDPAQGVRDLVALLDERDRQIEDYLSINAVSSATVYAAIVDSNFTADDATKSPKQFRNLDTALASIGNVNPTVIAIVARSSAYTLTASVASGAGPNDLTLHGIGGEDGEASLDVRIAMNGFTISCNRVALYNITFTASAATVFINNQFLNATNCGFQNGSAISTGIGGGQIYTNLINCGLSALAKPGNGSAGGEAFVFGGTIDASSSPTWLNPIVEIHGTRIWWSGSTWNLSPVTTLVMDGVHFVGDSRYGGGGGGTLTLTLPAQVRITATKGTATSAKNLTMNLTDPTEYLIDVIDTDSTSNTVLTVTWTTTAPLAGEVRGTYNTIDVKGPARIDAATSRTSANTVKLRGTGINADVVVQTNLNTANAAAVQGLTLTKSRVNIAAQFTGTVNGQQAYNEDATSGNNIVDVAGDSSYPVTSTFQAGSLTRVT